MKADDARTLGVVLRTVAEEARPARLPEDLWTRGMRRHRTRVTVAVAAVALLAAAVALPAAVASRWQRPVPADGKPAVPYRVYPPLPGQGTVVDAPPGPAALVVTGPGGFGTRALFGGYEDRALVVGANGSYRMVRHIDGFAAGKSLLLSPDGRHVAGDWGLEGGWTDRLGAAATTVVDLTTGSVRTYKAGVPVAWFPDGARLLTSTGELNVLNLDTGAVDPVGVRHEPNNDASVALSPDGRRAALQTALMISVVDLATHHARKVIDLDGLRTLAGPGAWTADGRLALWRCTPSCQGPPRVDLDLMYVDADSGAEVDGPAIQTTDVVGARVLGWQQDGDAIVVRYRDTGASSGTAVSGPGPGDVTAPVAGQPEVVALHPGGGSTVFVTLPDAAHGVDVARGLLERFGGEPPSPLARFLDWLYPLAKKIALLVAVGAAIYAVLLTRRRRRTGFWRRFPGGAGAGNTTSTIGA